MHPIMFTPQRLLGARLPRQEELEHLRRLKLATDIVVVVDFIFFDELTTQCCCGELSRYVTFIEPPHYTDLCCRHCVSASDALLQEVSTQRSIYFDTGRKSCAMLIVRNELERPIYMTDDEIRQIYAPSKKEFTGRAPV